MDGLHQQERNLYKFINLAIVSIPWLLGALVADKIPTVLLH